MVSRFLVSSVPSAQRHCSILILDELDNLSGASPALLKPLFSLVALYPKKVKVIGIANTHTLTSTTSVIPLSMDDETEGESARSVKIKTIHFSPYEPSELQAILAKRFEGLPQDELKKLLPAPTLVLLTKKVSSLTGDVRVLFEVLRGAIDIAIPSAPLDLSPTPSSSVPTEGAPKAPTTVTPAHILGALKSYSPASAPSMKKAAAVSSTSETVMKVANLNLQSRLVILALVLACRRLQATLPLTKCASPSLSPSTPSKKSSPMKRSNSSQSSVFGPAAGGQCESVDCGQLYTYYTALLEEADSFTAVSRSDFTDLLGVLDTSGLVLFSSLAPSASRTFKRTTSFTGASKAKASAASPSCVRFQSEIREAEVVRGLGIGSEAAASTDGDVLEDDVRRLWAREISKMKREAQAKDEAILRMLEAVEGFEDAMED